ncbi:MAG: thrombospondin type 3 repeat-containing protein [Myxococcales bacterium]|nr:thrombospondin type 3 repeat-containing protein [Myxococcales bacterium]
MSWRSLICAPRLPLVALPAALLALPACREPHTAQTNIAGQLTQEGAPIAEPILDPQVVANGQLTVTGATMDPLSLLYNDLTLHNTAQLAGSDIVAVIERICGPGECNDPQPDAGVPSCPAKVFTCTPAAGDWCATFYWNREPGEAQIETPVPSDVGPVGFPFDMLTAVTEANDTGNEALDVVGCASVPIALDLPEDILGEIPGFLVKRSGLPTIQRRTTFGVPSESTCDDLGCSGLPVNAAGLWFPFEVVPIAPLERELTCPLDGGGDPVCAQFIGEVPQVALDVLSVPCKGAKLGVRVNSLPLYLGLVPREGAPGGGAWTTALGGVNFHLEDMFRVVPVIAGTPEIAIGSLDLEGDVAAYLKGVPYDENLDVCNFALGVVHDILADLLRARIIENLTPIHRALEERIGPLMAFEGALPSACGVIPNCDSDPGTPEPPCCTDEQLTTWAAASLTYQKWHWFAGAFGPYQGSIAEGWLPVTSVSSQSSPSACDSPNAFADPACDGASTQLVFTFDPDPDGDGVLTPIDPAPNCAGPSLDSDEDGVADPCDGCPNDPDSTTDQKGEGGDGDGVCNDVDNCPGIYNPDQANCNRDAERALGFDELGDACDPVPCARVTADYAYSSSKLMQCKELTELQVQPLHPQPHDKAMGFPASWPLQDVGTSFFFCMNDVEGTIDCWADAAVNEAWLNDPNCAPGYPGTADCGNYLIPKPETASSWFHRIDIEGAPKHLVALDYVNDGSEPAVGVDWNWQADIVRWLDTGLISKDVVTGVPFGQSSEHSVMGRLWAHAATPLGSPELPEPSLHGDGLSNSYTDITTLHCKPNPWFEVPKFDKCVIDPMSCVALPWSPDIYINPWDQVTRFDVEAPEHASILVHTGKSYGALLPNGAAELVDERIGRGARTALDTAGMRWVAAGEASPAMGSARAPAIIGLDAEGRLAAALYSVGSRLESHEDLGAALPRGQALPARLLQATYARSRSEVLAIGEGRSGSELFALSLATGEWRSLGTTGGRGTVEALAWSARFGAVYWLERSSESLSLSRRSVYGGPTETLWTGPTRFDRHHLTVDVHGRVNIAATLATGGWTVFELAGMTRAAAASCREVAPPDPNADPSQPEVVAVVGVTSGEGTLPFAPVADPAGLTVVEVRGELGATRRIDAKQPVACAELDLGGR